MTIYSLRTARRESLYLPVRLCTRWNTSMPCAYRLHSVLPAYEHVQLDMNNLRSCLRWIVHLFDSNGDHRER